MSDYQIDLDFNLNPDEVKAETERMKADITAVNTTSQAQAKKTAEAISLSSKKFAENVRSAEVFTARLAEINVQTKQIAATERELNKQYKSGAIDINALLSGQQQLITKERELKLESKLVNEELNKMGASTMPRTARSAQGLNMSINQITREMPAFAYSAQTGFLALSNNIPILADEINRLKANNDELIKSGQKAPSLFSQIAKGLFSWQTLLSVGVTLLTIYGKEVGNFLASLFKGRKAIDQAKESMKALNTALDSADFTKAVSGVSELRIKLDLAKKGMADKKTVVDQYNESIGKVAGQVQTLDEVEKGLAENAQAYVKMTLFKAAANQVLEESAKKAADLQRAQFKNAEDFANGIDKMQANLAATGGLAGSQYGVGTFDASTYRDLLKQEGEERKKAYEDQLKRDIDDEENIAKELFAKASEQAKKMGGVLDLDTGDGDKDKTKAATELANALDRRRDLLNKISDLDDEFLRKSYDKDAEELQALRDKFEKARRIIKEFNDDPKNSKVAKIDISAIDPIEERAVSDLRYRQDTEKLGVELKKQKEMFAAYEAYKRQVSETEANKRFENDLKGFKSYGEVLKTEIAKLYAGGDELSGVQKERLQALQKELEAYNRNEAEASSKLYAEAYNSALTYEEKVIRIKLDFAKRAAEISKITDADLRDAKLKELDTQQNAAIDAARDEALKKTEIYRNLSNTLIGFSKKELEIRIRTLKSLLANSDIDDQIKKNIEADIKHATDALSGTETGTETKQLENRKRKILEILQTQKLSTAEYQKQVDELANINAELDQIKGKTFNKISDALGSVSGSFSELGNSLSGVNDDLAYALSSLGEIAKVGSDAAGSVASFMSGDIVGGITKGISAIAGLFSMGKKVKEMNRQAREEVEKFYEQALKGEREYQAILRDRERQQIRLNKLTLEGLQDQAKLLGQQRAVIESQINSLLSQLQAEQYVVSSSYKHGTWFRKARTTYTYGGLAGMSYEEIEQLYAQEKLTDGAKALFEELRKLKEEGKNVAQTLEDLAEESQKLFTGTTADSITDSIISGFEQGYRSAEDFADGFKDLMRKALLESFKYKVLEKDIAAFYEQFASAAGDSDGLTESDISELERRYSEIINNASQDFKNLEKVTGIGFDNNTNQTGLTGAIRREMTEQTGSELTGLFRSYFDIQKQTLTVNKDGLQTMRSQLLALLAIKVNTANTVSELQKAVGKLDIIANNTKQGMTSRDQGI